VFESVEEKRNMIGFQCKFGIWGVISRDDGNALGDRRLISRHTYGMPQLMNHTWHSTIIANLRSTSAEKSSRDGIIIREAYDKARTSEWEPVSGHVTLGNQKMLRIHDLILYISHVSALLIQYYLIFIPVLDYVSKMLPLGRDVTTHWIGSRRLGSTSLSRDNNLVYRKDSSCSFGSKLDRPTLRYHEIQDSLVFGIESTSVILVLEVSVVLSDRAKRTLTYLNINTGSPVISLVVCSV
jgi:hypothetical protein